MLSGLYFGSEHPKAAAAGFGESLLPVEGSGRMKVENAQNSMVKKIVLDLPLCSSNILRIRPLA